MATVAQQLSPFAAAAACGSPFGEAPQQPLKRSFTCGGPGAAAAHQQQQQHSLPLQLDLDALLAAASRKPGYGAEAQAQAAEAQAQAAAAARAAAVAAVLEQYGAAPIAAGCAGGIADAARAAIADAALGDTFYVYDLGEVARLHAAWVAAMPRVAPFYAVKCNPEPGVVALLDALGAGFDCASVQELRCAAAHGVPQDRIIFANPCKRPADFRYAREHGVQYTTFDCASELEKIAAGYPAFRCVLRIRCDDDGAKINLGLKYGADPADAPALLAMARRLGLEVVGVSFHVGSGCQNVRVYGDAIAAARQAFDAAAAAGFAGMRLLDIGGGFTAPHDGPSARLFYETAAVINGALARWFPPSCGVRVIAEPGRYFAETSATLFTTILGQRCSYTAAAAAAAAAPAAAAELGAAAAAAAPAEFRDYWLSDGTYGSFRIQVAVDGLEPSYSVLRSPLLPPPPAEDEARLVPCRLWGNSERDGDVVHKAALLPPLRDGDWLMFPDAGAYTICAASNFSGVAFTQPQKVYVYSAAATRDFGGYDAAGAAAACAAAAAAAASAAAPMLPCAELRSMLRGLSVSCRSGGGSGEEEMCTGESDGGAAPALELRPPLGSAGRLLSPRDLGSCVDLGELDDADGAGAAAAGRAAPAGGEAEAQAPGTPPGAGGAPGSLALLRAAGSRGSSGSLGAAVTMECASAASEGTVVAVGGGCGGSAAGLLAGADGAQDPMEVTSAAPPEA